MNTYILVNDLATRALKGWCFHSKFLVVYRNPPLHLLRCYFGSGLVTLYQVPGRPTRFWPPIRTRNFPPPLYGIFIQFFITSFHCCCYIPANLVENQFSIWLCHAIIFKCILTCAIPTLSHLYLNVSLRSTNFTLLEKSSSVIIISLCFDCKYWEKGIMFVEDYSTPTPI